MVMKCNEFLMGKGLFLAMAIVLIAILSCWGLSMKVGAIYEYWGVLRIGIFLCIALIPLFYIISREVPARLCRIKESLGNILFFLRCYLTMSLIRKAFSRLHYPIDVIALCVRWYLAYSLSLRNLEEMIAERGVIVDHSTLHRWVIRLVPLLDKTFRRHKRPVGRRWRMDETYIKIKGQWKYLYRAVDTAGQTIDFLLTAKRDAAAAQRFFRKAIRHHGEPETVTIDKSGANTTALATLNAGKPDEKTITIRQSKYLNNMVEQDHRNIKRRTRPMLGFKSFRRAQTILAGIELIHMIRKGQLRHPAGDGLSRAEQFYLLAA